MARRVIAQRYTQTREIGRGGMGVVWLARDEVLGREVALKRIGQTPGGDTPDLARAEREAKLAASLNHPHVVGVFDLVHDGDERWLVMEYVDGVDLGALVRTRGPLPPESAAKLLAQVADALAAAHRAGIVHRDIKPSNILVSTSGQVKLTDFGIARMHADATLTQTGMVTGSPAYLAPEVASGRPATSASDVWGLGATLFHALSGRPPYEVNGNVLGAMYQVVHADPPRLPDAGALGPVLEHTMDKEASRRWSVVQVRDRLAAIGAGAPLPTADDATVLARPLLPRRGTAAPEPAPEPAPTVSLPATRVAPPAGPSAGPPGVRPAPAEPRRRRGVQVLAGAVALLLLGGGGWYLLTRDSGGTDTTGTPGPSSSSSSPSGSGSATTSAEATAMTAFVTDYLATVTSDPKAAWEQLTPTFQRQSGGFGAYQRFWRTISSAEVLRATADPEAGTVSYTVRYTKADGSTVSDAVTLQLVPNGDSYLIGGEP